MATSPLTWIVFNLSMFFLLALDLFLHRRSRVISIKEALFFSAGWIALALLFNIYIFFDRGGDAALTFFLAYLVEKALSVDNLFVILLIFNHFKTPPALQHHVLFWGVLGAIVMRALFIFAGIAVISLFHFVFYIFGAFLLYTGIKLLFEKQKDFQPEKNLFLKLCSKCFPLTPHYVGAHFFTRLKGSLYATPLFVVLIAVETTDLLFALDSIPVVLGITLDPFLVYTSNICAILGLRSLFFALSHLMTMFSALHYSLSAILIFIAIKMLLADFIVIPLTITLPVIVLFLLIPILVTLKRR